MSGGEFVYADTAFGKTHAFLCGWFISIAYWALIPMNGTAVGLVARYLVPGPLQAVKLYEIAGWPVYLASSSSASLPSSSSASSTCAA